MKENKISNIKIEVPVGIEMNDKDYLTSILELEKICQTIIQLL